MGRVLLAHRLLLDFPHYSRNYKHRISFPGVATLKAGEGDYCVQLK